MLFPTPDTDYYVSRLPVRTLIRLAFEDDLVTFRRALRHLKSVMLGVVHDFVPAAMWALLPNHRATTSALVALDLALGDHTWHYLLTDYADALTTTRGTCAITTIGGDTL